MQAVQVFHNRIDKHLSSTHGGTNAAMGDDHMIITHLLSAG